MANKDENKLTLKDIAIVSCVWGPLLFIFIVGGVWESGRFDGTIMEQLFPAILFGFVAAFLTVIILSNLFQNSIIWWISGILAFIATVIIYMYYNGGFVMVELDIFGIEELEIFSLILAIIALLLVFFYFKKIIWDEPHDEIRMLKNEIYNLEKRKEDKKIQEDIEKEKQREIIKNYENKVNSLLKEFESNLSAIPYMAGMIADIETYGIEKIARGLAVGKSQQRWERAKTLREIRENAQELISQNKEAQYKLAYLLELFPHLSVVLENDFRHLSKEELKYLEYSNKNAEYIARIEICATKKECEERIQEYIKLCDETNIKYKKIQEMLKTFKSNISTIPYMAGMIADIETYGLENLAQGLDWGHNQERLKKVKSIREIRKDAKAIVEKNKEAQYQLAYLLELFPNLNDVIECEFNQLPMIEINALSDYDATRDYLSKEEYERLTVTERNQLALDRYNDSHNKTKWQIGRDYEQYVGYQYRKKGYEVDDFGSYMGLEDLGRDIIAKKDDAILIIQCKYWSSIKQIHEKHITQLYGTMISYCIENNIEQSKVKGVLVTNIQLSDMAKKMATYLDINYVENFEMGKYPQIKCNIGHSDYGEKIYHLPFDQQYDTTKIDKDGEFYAMTVAEAEDAGFRRAFKWFGNQ